jgi:hypothetical protein
MTKFIQYLEEASNIPLDQLKDRMKKDPRVKMIFQRTLNLDEIKDKDEFIRTLRYYLFSNENVRRYVEKRGSAANLSGYGWKNINKRLQKGSLGQQYQLDALLSIVKDLFSDASMVQKKNLSKRAHDDLHSWLSRQSIGWPTGNLSVHTAYELASLELKPTKPTTLYKAFMFDELDFRQISSWSGDGQGLNFLKSIRQGKRIADLDFNAHSVWSTNKKHAMRDAIFGQHTWSELNDNTPRKIANLRGVLSFVVSIRATPDNVLVDFSQTHPYWGWPNSNSVHAAQMIIRPGKYACRVTNKFTKEGEVDLDAGAKDDAGGIDLEQVKEQLSLLGRILKLPFPKIYFEGVDRAWNPEEVRQIAVLADTKNQEIILKLMRQVISLYNKHFRDIDVKEISSQASQNPATFKAIVELQELFKQTVSHKKYANPHSRTKHGAKEISDVDPDDLATINQNYHNSNLKNAVTTIESQKRSTQYQTLSVFSGLAKIADPNYSKPDNLHLRSWKQQKEYIDLALDGFYKIIGKPKPTDPKQQAQDFYEIMEEANVYAQLARFLQDLKTIAQSVNE